MDNTNKKYSFTLILNGISEPSEELENRLFESGCDDATLSFRNQIAYLDFEREAENPEIAVLSSISDIETSKGGITVARIEPADPVTAAEIARRLNRTRESVRLLIKGSRGSGEFPLPIAGVTSTSMIWSWSDVTDWCYKNGILKNQMAAEFAHFIRNMNIALKFRSDSFTINEIIRLVQVLQRDLDRQDEINLSI